MTNPISTSARQAAAQAYDDPNTARLDADGMAHPSAPLTAYLTSSLRQTGEVAANQIFSSGREGRNQARSQALDHIAEFYRMRIDPHPNAHYLNESQFGRTSPRDQAALRRQNSFLSVVRQLDDVQTLAFTPEGQLEPYLNSDSNDVMEQTLKSIQVLPAALQEAAKTRARAGERSLPLSLDRPRMNAFLAAQDARLAQVIEACPGGVADPARLTAPLTALATEYLRCNGLMPSGLPPASGLDYRGLPVSTEPVAVWVDRFPESAGEYFYDSDDRRDTVVISVGQEEVSGPMARYTSSIDGFPSRTPAQQRAAIIVQTLFENLTGAEEGMHAAGLHARNDEERRRGEATAAELRYLGSPRIGDAIDAQADGPSQRVQSLMPLVVLARHEAQRKQAGGRPMVAHWDLVRWMTSANFDADVADIANPGGRLSHAQIPYTADALAKSRAFGGAGLR